MNYSKSDWEPICNLLLMRECELKRQQAAISARMIDKILKRLAKQTAYSANTVC